MKNNILRGYLFEYEDTRRKFQRNNILRQPVQYMDTLYRKKKSLNSATADALMHVASDRSNLIDAIIADSITSIAEEAYKLYLRVEKLMHKHPQLTAYANLLVSEAKIRVESTTDMNTNTMGWVDLGKIWLFEIGGYDDDTIQFGPNDATTKDLKKQEGVVKARAEAMKQIATGNISNIVHHWKYGQKEFYSGMSGGNLATSFLGSYDTNVSITLNANGSYSLRYTVFNTSGWESATRLRKDNDGNGQHDGIIPDKKRGVGIKLGGNLEQRWTWTETVNTQ